MKGEPDMADLPKYHLRAQQADALLAPINATLQELEGRVQHYLDRVALDAPDANVLAKAHDVLTHAAQELARVLDDSRQIHHD